MKKNVLILQYSSEIGGAETDLLDFLRRGPHDGVNITVLCPGEGPLIPLLRETGVNVQFLRLWPWRKGKYLFHRMRAVAALISLVKTRRIDVIHVNDFWSFPYADAVKKRLPGILTIAHVRGDVDQRKIKNYHLLNASRLVVVSGVIRNALIDAGGAPHNIHVHFGYGDYEARLKRTRETLSASLTDSSIVGLIARLIDIKGIEYFIDAIPAVMAQYPDARFQIIGTGKDRYVTALQERSREKGLGDVLCFCGFQDDVFPYLMSMSILVSASLTEGLGRTMLYAMAAGIPGVATDAGGTIDLVLDGETGYLVPKKDSRLLAERMLRLLSNRTLRSQMGAAARRRYEEIYLDKDFTSALCDLYRSDDRTRPVQDAPGAINEIG